MNETGILEIDGKRMKKCPGWDGNSFRCGKGNPRLIPEAAEVCENCSRGMRKRGQLTREEEEKAAKAEKAAKDRLALGVAAFQKKLAAPVEPETIAHVLAALELTEGDLGETYHYWEKEEIGSDTKLGILYAAAGVEPPDKLRARGRGRSY